MTLVNIGTSRTIRPAESRPTGTLSQGGFAHHHGFAGGHWKSERADPRTLMIGA
jgi:hypothetical protein